MPQPLSTPTSTPQPHAAPKHIGELPSLREAAPTRPTEKVSNGSPDEGDDRKANMAIAMVVFAAVVFATLLLLSRVGLGASADGSGFLYHVVGGLSFLVVVHAVLLIHEGGHAIAARLAGLQPQLVAAGMLVFDRRDNRRWRVRLGPMVLGGVAYSTIRSWPGLERFRRSFRTSVAGGPIGSVVGFLIGVATLVVVARATGAHPPRWAGFLEFGSFASLYIAAIALVPGQTKTGLYTDGAQLQRWRPFDADGVARRAWIPSAAAAQLSIERRPREWDAEVVRLLEESARDPEMGGLAAVFLAYRALDLSEPLSAGQWLQKAIDQQGVRSGGMMELARVHVALAAAIYEGAWRRDADAARRWIAISRSARPMEAWLRQVAVAALHWADGKPWHLDRASGRMDSAQAASPTPISRLLLHTTIERLTAARHTEATA